MDNQQYTWDNIISCEYGQKINAKKNTILFRQGEIGQGFYFLKKGEVKISLLSNQGIERDIDYVMPGNLLGEHGFNHHPYFTTASISAPSTLYFFSKKDFDQLCLDIPEASNLFMQSLILKVRLLAETTAILNAPADYRLAHFLYKLHLRDYELRIKLSQVSLARYIGTSRVTVYKIINQWKAEEMIDYDQGYIHFLDITKLKYFLDNALYSSSK
ncbi:Crp/Fnr family transcriptional regulator [Sporosarcina sp. FSL K6-3508]|uniref:Crp/Fnr family transcriptional regulator n=1 Tax=Sporosarcina sp. FSL K6-3508 TaxID=2921557 RepID=UPI00315AA4BD